MSPTRACVLWRRVDAPGHDACRLLQCGGGWLLEGTTVFRDERGPALLRYRVSADGAWRTRAAEVEGWTGTRAVQMSVVRNAAGEWLLNGAVQPAARECLDLDLGFTPATNLLTLRRLALQPGAARDLPVAWTEAGAAGLRALMQHYERIDAVRYAYSSPAFGYAAVVEVSADGFVTRYPGLWEAVAGAG